MPGGALCFYFPVRLLALRVEQSGGGRTAAFSAVLLVLELTCF